MNKKLFSLVRTVLLVLVVTATAGSKLYAIDSNNRYFSYGVRQKTCEDYIKFREKRLEMLERHERYTKDEPYEIVDKIVEHWIAEAGPVIGARAGPGVVGLCWYREDDVR